jgi:hypothetical protein
MSTRSYALAAIGSFAFTLAATGLAFMVLAVLR